ncbi:hypothetical protein [endosymbiont GvMRE of Glomus versiforme]|uniref:hypothetical protein n=1 Tax=endosymbiont GvMRE of Glomus versiforme TaxID=2039283 RepID=UPI000EB990F0|nr:hypothetical protein [endosymbiont GvMRE of Glomus versiforme]RHZ36647.1 hypothetical protein GvMRE_I2g545 [endosymbiont GvMRE of Glomus versiforme]
MPQIKKTKPKKTKKPVSRTPAKSKPKKNTALIKNKSAQTTCEYYECMRHQTKQGIKPKKITQVAHECKTNALALNAKMSANQKKAAQKIKVGYKTLGEGLSEFIKSK